MLTVSLGTCYATQGTTHSPWQYRVGNCGRVIISNRRVSFDADVGEHKPIVLALPSVPNWPIMIH